MTNQGKTMESTLMEFILLTAYSTASSLIGLAIGISTQKKVNQAERELLKEFQAAHRANMDDLKRLELKLQALRRPDVNT